jgi:hypothetical protein
MTLFLRSRAGADILYTDTQKKTIKMVPLEGIEPPLPVPKTGALSFKLQGLMFCFIPSEFFSCFSSVTICTPNFTFTDFL